MSHKLTPKQVKAIYLLAEGHTSIEVARVLKLRRETLSRWKKSPEFANEFEDVMLDLREDMKHRLVNMAHRSISTLTYGVNRNFSSPEGMRVAFSVLKLLNLDRLFSPDTPIKEEKQPLPNQSPSSP